MNLFSGKKVIVGFIILLAIVAIALYSFSKFNKKEVEIVPVVVPKSPVIHEVIGMSVENREINAYTYGEGERHIVFVGGIHGGYEWNSVYLAYRFMDYLKENPDTISPDLKVTVIPSLNIDAVYKVTKKEGKFEVEDVATSTKVLEAARFNANEVDLNRNFDCNWKPESTWRSKKVSAGESAFSEPEALTLKNFVEKNSPDAFIFWHSQANAVYASECNDGILPSTLDLMNTYAKAAGYPAIKSFDAYPITGDAEGWLASINIPAITVELKTHETIEWDKNLRGIKAVLGSIKK